MKTIKEEFDRNYWRKNLKHKDWYIRLGSELGMLLGSNLVPNRINKDFSSQLYELVKNMLIRNQIPLATTGPDFDKGRKFIDTIVIHHTARVINDSNTLSAIGLIRQYGFDYLNKDVLGYNVHGEAVWSGHFLRSKQIFSAYHWFINTNGYAQRLLKDEYVGWHAGNWDINLRSVGIALSGNFEKDHPSVPQMQALIRIINKYYSQVSNERIFGHNEIAKGTLCPGKNLQINKKF